MRNTLTVSILIFLTSATATAQQHLVDSITKELQQSIPDSIRALSMMRLAVDYEVVDTAKAFKAYRNAIQFSGEKKMYYLLGRTYQNQSFLFSTAGNYQQAVTSLDTAILNYRKSDHPKAKQWEANAYSDLANSLKSQNEYQQAVQYYLKSISLLEEMKMTDKLVTTYCNVSSIFGDMGERTKQTEYAYKAVEAAKKSGSREYLFTAYFMLANSYNSQDDSRSAKIFLDSAGSYFNEADVVDNIDVLFSYYMISAQVYKKLDQLDSSFYFFQKDFDLSKKYNYGYGKAASQLEMGAVALLQKKYADAEKYLLAGIEDAKSINVFGILNEGYKFLSDIYAVTGRYKEAYEFYQKHKEINDSVVNMDSKKYATELEKKYESEKKDKQITLQQSQLQKRRILNYVLVGSAIVLLIISLLSYRTYRQKQKLQQQRINELETEKQLAATEAVLKGEEQERTRLAKDLHDGLGGMLSGIKYSLNAMKGNLIMTPDNTQAFERSMNMLDSSIKEMRRVAHNMMPESLVKFGLDTALKDFCHDVNQSGAIKVNYQSIGLENAMIDQTTAITVYRIVQELLNNTMKHAAATSVIVQVSKNDGSLSVTVEDDGKGFDASILTQPLTSQHSITEQGIGWSNIRNRVDFLKGKFNVHSEAGKGTSVLIELHV